MVFTKRLFTGIFIFLLSFNLVFALSLQVSVEPVSTSIINDQDVPAVFKLRVFNSGSDKDFEFFSYEKFKIEPGEFSLKNSETKIIETKFYPIESMKYNIGYVTFSFYIKDKSNPGDMYKIEKVSIRLVDFKNALDIKAENINPEANFCIFNIQNLEDMSYGNLEILASSAFSDDKKEAFFLRPYEKKELTVSLDKQKIKKLFAGAYNFEVFATSNGKTTSFKVPVKILEKSGLSVNEQSSGLIVRKHIVEKVNEGNILSVADIMIRKNIISRLFSTFSLEPDRVERKGLFIDYSWQKELQPAQSLKVEVVTNWMFPFLLFILVVVIGFLTNMFLKQDLIIMKRIGFVRTKSNELALKVNIHVKSKKFIENVKIYDKLPVIAKLYEQFGDPKPAIKDNGRLEWNFEYLSPGEERILTYIFYSKINVVGKFELPSVTGIYEIAGKPHESKSNKVFFVNEPKRDYSVNEK